jgi:hypothetical protein
VLGLYLGVEAGKLRYFTPDGDLVPTPEEAAIATQQIAIAAQQQASEAQSQLEQERMRSQKLAEQLRALGIDPESLT